MKIKIALVYNKIGRKYEFCSWHVARMIERQFDAVLAKTYSYVGETAVECPDGTIMTYSYADMIASTESGEYRLKSRHNERGLYPDWEKVA